MRQAKMAVLAALRSPCFVRKPGPAFRGRPARREEGPPDLPLIPPRPYTAMGRKPKCRERSLSASCLSGHSHIPVHRRRRESGHRRVMKNEFFITLLGSLQRGGSVAQRALG